MNLTEIRNALKELDARPRQVLGQNFLHDNNLARKEVEAAGLQPSDTVVEIGPGLGSLTELLVGKTARLILLEKDQLMVRWLKGRFGSFAGVEVQHLDALDFDLRQLWGGGRVIIIGNLPYYVSTPLIAHFSGALSPADRLVFLLQREVGDRMAAKPGSSDYGGMSVRLQRRWHVEHVHKVPPQAFYPAPSVGSSIVRLTRRDGNDLQPLDEACFEEFVRAGFAARRKQLRTQLPELKPQWPHLTQQLGIEENVRAENLSLDQWENLTKLVAPLSAQKDEELFDEVDERDFVIGPKTRGEIHVNNLRHRAVHMLIFNQLGELYLQLRSPWKDLNPSVWDSSAAGHVDSGEDYAFAAGREVEEELGVSVDLQEIGKLDASPETSWEFVKVFRGQSEGPFTLARLEVETGAFFSLDKIGNWLKNRPQDFSPLFRLIFPRFVSCFASDSRYV